MSNSSEKQYFNCSRLYAYGFRQFDSQIARWHSIDKLAESFPSVSPYAYVAGNPVSMVDVLGLLPDHGYDQVVYNPFHNGGAGLLGGSSSGNVDPDAALVDAWLANGGEDGTGMSASAYIKLGKQIAQTGTEEIEVFVTEVDDLYTTLLMNGVKYIFKGGVTEDQMLDIMSSALDAAFDDGGDGDPTDTYTVEKGDGLYKIARDKYGWGYSYNSWLRANPNLTFDSNGNPELKPGQVLNVPTQRWDVKYMSHKDFISIGDSNIGDYLGVAGPIIALPIINEIISTLSFTLSFSNIQHSIVMKDYGNNNCGVLVENYHSTNNSGVGLWHTYFYLYTTGEFIGYMTGKY